MTETITPPAAGSPPAAAGDPNAGNPPEGFVSRAELEREQARARTFQAEKDRLDAELARLKSAPPTPTPSAGADDLKGFDPAAFSQDVLNRVYMATALSSAAVSLKSEFPNADPAIFSPEKLSQYGSVDALRIAAEADHVRVTNLSASRDAEIEARVRAEMVAAYGQEPPTGPSGAGAPAPGGDPTPQQLAAMSFDEFARFDRENPGVADRVTRSASPDGMISVPIV